MLRNFVAAQFSSSQEATHGRPADLEAARNLAFAQSFFCQQPDLLHSQQSPAAETYSETTPLVVRRWVIIGREHLPQIRITSILRCQRVNGREADADGGNSGNW